MGVELPRGVSRYNSDVPGARVVIIGGVHGDEPCGVIAVHKLQEELARKELRLARGSLTLIIANHDALKKNVRLVERNMNRLFKDNSQEIPSAEARRAEELKPIVADADFMLDLHSTALPSPPFILCESAELPLTAGLGIERVVLGWGALGDSSSGDAETWARNNGAKSFTLECGQHLDAGAPGIAYEVARRFLSVSGIVDSAVTAPSVKPEFLTLYHFEKLRDREFRYCRDFASFTPLKAGELIGRDRHKEHRPAIDSFLIFPGNPREVEMGTELYFLAKKTPA